MATESSLELLKKYFDQFSDFEDFEKRYLNVYNPQNREALIQFFNDIKSSCWDFAKLRRSSETFRIDKAQKNGTITTIPQILEYAKSQDLSKYKKAIICLENKDYENLEDLRQLNFDIFIQVTNDSGICTLDEFQYMRQILKQFRDYYSTFHLSPLEKVTIAYDCVKFYQYNETEASAYYSRTVAKVLDTGSIVCAGYSRFFCQLLKELGMNAYLLFVGQTDSDHVRVMVNIQDEKYGVSDLFVFDPTWDSNKNIKLVKKADGTVDYKFEINVKEDDTIVEGMISDISYMFYMVPLMEYKKYFSDNIFKAISYKTQESMELDSLKKLSRVNNQQPREDSVLDLLPKVLLRTKKMEGYNQEQIDWLIEHSVNFLKATRFGYMDKYRKDNQTHK